MFLLLVEATLFLPTYVPLAADLFQSVYNSFFPLP